MPRATVIRKLDYANMCSGRPRDPDQGHYKQCPKRGECHHYLIALGTGPAKHGIDSPYDFDDDSCSEFQPEIS